MEQANERTLYQSAFSELCSPDELEFEQSDAELAASQSLNRLDASEVGAVDATLGNSPIVAPQVT